MQKNLVFHVPGKKQMCEKFCNLHFWRQVRAPMSAMVRLPDLAMVSRGTAELQPLNTSEADDVKV